MGVALLPLLLIYKKFIAKYCSSKYNCLAYRYTIAQENIPSFLEHLADKILHTGKYLNVVRECGVEVACPGVKGESSKDTV